MKICHVSTLGFKENIEKIVETRGDDWAKAVKKRVTFDTDLVAAEAKYHQNCLTKFNSLVSQGKKVGRPVVENVSTAMEKIFSFIENNKDSQFTLTELKSILTDYIPDDKTIKKNLKRSMKTKLLSPVKKQDLRLFHFERRI